MRIGYVKRLPWKDMASYIPEASMLNDLTTSRQKELDWWDIGQFSTIYFRNYGKSPEKAEKH